MDEEIERKELMELYTSAYSKEQTGSSDGPTNFMIPVANAPLDIVCSYSCYVNNRVTF